MGSVPVKEIIKRLRKERPDAKVELNYHNPFQLLIATILSAQSTDVQVNKVTEILFDKYPTPEKLAAADLEELKQIVKPTGFFNNKAKNISNCSKMLVEKYNGKVPSQLDALVKLPGVGRKTANVVLGAAFGVAGIVVDTHMERVSQRLGLTAEQNPEAVERDLMEQVDREDWIDFSILMVLHGRYTCKARKPLCPDCTLNDFCNWPNKVI